MKRLILLPLFLAGCAHDQPGIQVRTVTVDRIVQRPCPGTKPERPAPLAKPLPTSLEALAAALAEKLAEYALPGGYADKADAIMTRCLSPAPDAPPPPAP